VITTKQMQAAARWDTGMAKPEAKPPLSLAASSGTWCPECREQKPRDPDNMHDIVLMRMDWRKAGRPERTRIEHTIGYSPMCLECNARITIEWAPKSPSFDAKGDRLPNTEVSESAP
jgi:hypothetical protein